MTYFRVIPRDLFNEGNLLKCYGRLVILLDSIAGHTARLDEGDGGPFDIQQDEASGALTIANLAFSISGQPWRLSRPLNSRREYPLYASTDEEEVEVFDVTGRLTGDFRELIGLDR